MLRKSIIIIVTLAATFIFVFLFILPKKEALDDLKKTIQERDQELRAIEDYFKELNDISKNLEDYQGQLAKIKLAAPAGPQVLVFYNFLQKAASRAGLVLRDINYGLSENTIFLDLGVAGTMDGFKNFLSILEKSARMIDIESFSFTGPEKEKDVVNFNIKIKAYFID